MSDTVIADPLKLLDAIAELVSAHFAPGGTPTSQSGCANAVPPRHPLLESTRSRGLADMRMVICRATTEIRQYAAQHGCQVRMELPADPLMVQVSSCQLEVALMNLLRNAIDANATVVTLLGEIDQDRVEVRVDDDGDHLCVDALAPHSMDFAFRRLAQAGGSIARTIVEDHGGRLDLIPHAGRGTTACLTLPRTTDGVDS